MGSFWLDIKAYDDKVHRKLTASNKRILELPAETLERKFALEVSSLYIPDWVDAEQIRRIVEMLVQVDSVSDR